MIKLQFINNGNVAPALRIIENENERLMSLTDAFKIHHANEYLRSLNTGHHIEFKNWIQYIELIESIATA